MYPSRNDPPTPLPAAANEARPRSDEWLHASEAQFRLLVEGVKDYAIFMLTPEGIIASWNSGAQHIKGYEAHEIIGRHFSVFYPPEQVTRGWPEHELRIARATGRYEEEGWRLRKDGTRFWANVVITALYNPAKQLQGFAKVTRDLTVRRQIEELQRGERIMNEFLAMLGHELRNPLAPLHMALQILELKPDDRASVEWVREVFARQLGHLTRLVDDLLDVGRITSGKITLRFETLDLVTLVRETVDTMRPLLQAHGQSVDVTLPGEAVHVRGDATRLAQVITNLIGNASKYTPPGGRVHVEVEPGEDVTSLVVSDNGMGIPSHLLPRVFDLFVQGDRALDRKEGGLGIGLTLVRRLVELHGGTVSATSAGVDQGSEFTVRLARLRRLPAAADDERTGASTAGPLRVLVVDDNADVAQSIVMLLRILGHEVDTAPDGPGALARAEAFAPDLVLLDLGLPGIDGYEVARRMRADPRYADTLLVACTGYGRDEDRQRVMEAGFDEHLVKPVHASSLERIIADYAERRTHARRTRDAAQ